jgi:PAS domain S-box-containing protein
MISRAVKILLLEDMLLDAEVIQAALLDGGIHHELVRVETRSDFVQALEKNQFDLILSDYSLPDFDGISALRIVQDTHSEIPFILVSSSLGEELAIEILKSGATDYVMKHRLGRLAPSVQRALRESQERQERQQAEAKLQEQAHLLDLAYERFELAAAAVNCLIYDWNLESDFVNRTEGLTRILGYSLEEAEPTGAWWCEIVHPDDLQRVKAESAVVMATSDRYAAEYRVRNKNNQYIYVLDQGIVVSRDVDGNPLRIVGSTTDVTKRKHTEFELQRREQEFRALAENSPDIRLVAE